MVMVVVVRGDNATLIISASDGKSVMRFVKEGGIWKTD